MPIALAVSPLEESALHFDRYRKQIVIATRTPRYITGARDLRSTFKGSLRDVNIDRRRISVAAFSSARRVTKQRALQPRDDFSRARSRFPLAIQFESVDARVPRRAAARDIIYETE